MSTIYGKVHFDEIFQIGRKSRKMSKFDENANIWQKCRDLSKMLKCKNLTKMLKTLTFSDKVQIWRKRRRLPKKMTFDEKVKIQMRKSLNFTIKSRFDENVENVQVWGKSGNISIFDQMSRFFENVGIDDIWRKSPNLAKKSVMSKMAVFLLLLFH